MSEVLQSVMRGIGSGVLGLLILMYALRPTEPYPAWFLVPFHHPYMLIPLLIAWVFIVRWDIVTGMFFLFLMFAILCDVHLLGRSVLRTHTMHAMAIEAGEVGQIRDDTNTLSGNMWGLPLNTVANDFVQHMQYPTTEESYGYGKPGEPMPV